MKNRKRDKKSHRAMKRLTTKRASLQRKMSHREIKSLIKKKKVSRQKGLTTKENVSQQNKENKLKTIVINKTICAVLLSVRIVPCCFYKLC